MRKQWLFWLILTSSTARADILLTWEAPGVQSSSVAGVVTEGFDQVAPGNYTSRTSAFGIWTSPAPGFNIHAADVYGGAGGTGNYIAVGAESGQNEVDLTLAKPSTYLGLWLSAMGFGDTIQFYSKNVLLKSFDSLPVLAPSSAYLGNPNTKFKGEDIGEPFAYLNFSAGGGTTFDKVTFQELQGGGLEMDNVSILVPEPATPLLAAALCSFLVALRVRPSRYRPCRAAAR